MISRMTCFFFLALAISVLSLSLTDAALTIVDDFEDGTTQGWSHGGTSLNPPFNVPDGGPTGPGDNYLEVPSNGMAGEPGSRMLAWNITGWSADYTALPDTLQFDAINFTTGTDLFLRIGVCGPGGAFVSSNSIPVCRSVSSLRQSPRAMPPQKPGI